MATRHQVRDGEAHWHRTLGRVTAQPGQTGERLREQVLSRFISPRAAVTISADRSIDEPWIEGGRRSIIKSQALDDAGSEVLDQDIGAGDEVLYRRQVGWLLQIRSVTFL